MREIMVKPEVTEIKNIECALRVLSSAGKTVIWKNNCKEKNYYQHCFSNSHQLLNILGAKCGNCVRVCTNNLYFLISHLFCKPFQVLCCFSETALRSSTSPNPLVKLQDQGQVINNLFHGLLICKIMTVTTYCTWVLWGLYWIIYINPQSNVWQIIRL